MKHLSQIGSLSGFMPYSMTAIETTAPKRKQLTVSVGNNAFVKPVKQDFVKNARLMPGTRCMILMLMGWSGKEQALETTIGIIAKHIGRSARQVHRYLQDAIEEGYLYYSRTKDRMGYYTGIKIHLNFSALKPVRTRKTYPQMRRNKDMTSMSDTNSKYIYKRDNTEPESRYLNKLERILERNGLSPTPD